jgi:SAM-dependent methyltransferase
MEEELIPILKTIKPGRVLDVGSKSSPYISNIKNTEYKRLDIVPNSRPDYVADLHDLGKLPKNYFDVVIATEVLEHLYDPQKAVEEIRKVLKKGGICIATTRFIYHYHPDPHDYFRFTWDSLRYIFRNYQKVDVKHHGNYIQSMWQMINTGKFGFIMHWFNPFIAKIKSKKTDYPLGFLVYAIK